MKKSIIGLSLMALVMSAETGWMLHKNYKANKRAQEQKVWVNKDVKEERHSTLLASNSINIDTSQILYNEALKKSKKLWEVFGDECGDFPEQYNEADKKLTLLRAVTFVKMMKEKYKDDEDKIFYSALKYGLYLRHSEEEGLWLIVDRPNYFNLLWAYEFKKDWGF